MWTRSPPWAAAQGLCSGASVTVSPMAGLPLCLSLFPLLAQTAMGTWLCNSSIPLTGLEAGKCWVIAQGDLGSGEGPFPAAWTAVFAERPRGEGPRSFSGLLLVTHMSFLRTHPSWLTCRYHLLKHQLADTSQEAVISSERGVAGTHSYCGIHQGGGLRISSGGLPSTVTQGGHTVDAASLICNCPGTLALCAPEPPETPGFPRICSYFLRLWLTPVLLFLLGAAGIN